MRIGYHTEGSVPSNFPKYLRYQIHSYLSLIRKKMRKFVYFLLILSQDISKYQHQQTSVEIAASRPSYDAQHHFNENYI